MWDFLKSKRNRDIVSMIAGGVAAAAAGGWAVYTHFSDPGGARTADCQVSANASVAACGDVRAGSISITTAPAPAKP